ncbi:MAG: phage antirepressor N-terminal domain-containing protein [Muribaculaceae bacterium]|nr:phage antirepressor N-terminal domain-containing protein [Muribaculaceae bacterium]
MKEKENRLSIGTINGVNIYAINDENGQTLVPIKPICDAIGVAHQTQKTKIHEDEILSSVGTLRMSTGADGKQYDMFCLPLEFVYGWIFTINPRNVNPQAKESVIKYKRECYEVLYRHFFNRAQRQAESNQAEAAELEHLRQLIGQEKEVKSQINETKKRIDSIRASRLDDQPSLFD